MKKRVISIFVLAFMLINTLTFSAFAQTSNTVGIGTEHEDSLVFATDGIKEFRNSGADKLDFTRHLSKMKEAESFTLVCQFMQTEGVASSLLGISNSSMPAHHFHVYVDGSRVGYEFRNGADDSLSVSSYTANPFGINTLAFSANASEHTFKLYLNGMLIDTKKFNADTYKKLSDIDGLDSILVGSTDRAAGSNEYIFTGSIGELAVYSKAFSDSELKKYTSATPSTSTIVECGQPFSYGDDFGISAFRIPCLITLQNGNMLAAADLRSHLNDSPNNIEIGVRVLDKKTNTWSDPIIPCQFDDYEYDYSSKDSASFIDASLVQVDSGRIFLLTDVMPASGGGGIGGRGNGTVKIGDKYYYALTMGDPTAPSANYEYYLYPNPNSTKEYDKYIIKKVADNSDTGYTTNAEFYIYQNGKALTVKQKPNLEKDVPMNIFYSASLFKVYRTSYFWLIYSDDGGYNWSDPMLVGSEYRADQNEPYFNKSPGVGIEVKKGEYAGRILFPIYSGYYGAGTLVTRILYSDDGGKTWLMGERTTFGTTDSPTQASETQLIELPDGTIRMYTRTNTRYIGYADSIDGGVTFSPVVHDPALFYCRDCMVSVTNLKDKIDGKDAIAISYPEGTPEAASRTNGVLKIGLITENEGFDAPAYGRYTVEWKYSYDINDAAFWYSCLADKGDGKLAILYEPGPLVYDEFSIDKITTPEKDEKEPAATISFAKPDSSLCSVKEITLALNFKKQVYENFSKLESAKAYVQINGSEDRVALKYSHLSEDKKTVFFKGDVSLPESEQISFTFSLDDKNIIATPGGILIPSEVTDLICEMALHTECEHIEDDIPSDGETNENETKDETNDSDNTEKRGCGSSVVGSMSVSIIIIAALAISVAKNKRKIYN